MRKLIEGLTVAGWGFGVVVILVVMVAIGIAFSVALVAGLVALWIYFFGHPESFWGLLVCVYCIATISSILGFITNSK